VSERSDRSYADVVSAHAPALLRLAVMLTGDRYDAEDLLQQTLLRTVRHGARIAAMTAPAAYLRKVMLNEHLSRRRRRRAEVPQTGPVPVTPPPDVDARDETWRWLASLRPQQRAVLVLRFYEDLPAKAIAELLGCTETTVRSHAFRGLAALRSHLQSLVPEESP